MKVYREVDVIDPRFPNLGTSLRLASFTLRPLYPRYPLDKRLGRPQNLSERHGEENIFALPEIEIRPLVVQRVASH
jgi:hypothetical protein